MMNSRPPHLWPAGEYVVRWVRADTTTASVGETESAMDLSGVTAVADLPRVQARLRPGASAEIDAGVTTTFAELDAQA